MLLLSIFIDNSPGENTTLKSDLNRTIHGLRSLPNFDLIDSKSNSTLAHNPAYTIAYKYSENGKIYKIREFGTIIGNDKVLRLQYVAPEDKFEKRIQGVQHTIDSLELNVPTLKHKTSDFTVEYPYNWAVGKAFIPIGYKPEDVLTSSTFFSPIKGPYYFGKTYRLGIDYDFPYKGNGNGKQFPYTALFYANRNTTNPTWTKLIEEWSLDGNMKKILYNGTQSKNETQTKGFIEEGKGYITIPLDLKSLNLPDQFYISSRYRRRVFEGW